MIGRHDLDLESLGLETLETDFHFTLLLQSRSTPFSPIHPVERPTPRFNARFGAIASDDPFDSCLASKVNTAASESETTTPTLQNVEQPSPQAYSPNHTQGVCWSICSGGGEGRGERGGPIQATLGHHHCSLQQRPIQHLNDLRAVEGSRTSCGLSYEFNTLWTRRVCLSRQPVANRPMLHMSSKYL